MIYICRHIYIIYVCIYSVPSDFIYIIEGIGVWVMKCVRFEWQMLIRV